MSKEETRNTGEKVERRAGQEEGGREEKGRGERETDTSFMNYTRVCEFILEPYHHLGRIFFTLNGLV
jgi:hypothetical protein